MVSRKEFYIAVALVILLIVYFNYNKETAPEDIQIARIQTRDSIFATALKKDLKSDSLQAVINMKDLQLNNLPIKYVSIKENIVKLDADSALSFFLQSISH